MPQKLAFLVDPAMEPAAQPFMLSGPPNPADPIESRRRGTMADPFEVRLSGKLLRAQLRGTLPARHR